MGYTHYWTINPKGDQHQWSDALMRAMRVIERSPVPLADGCGDGDGPEYADDCIRLNGRERDRGAYETFMLPTVLRDADDRGFTKTGRRSYDVVVCAVLATMEHYAPTIIRASSDGAPLDWVDGVRLARDITGDNAIGLPRAVCTLAEYLPQYHAEMTAQISRAYGMLDGAS